MSNLIGLQASKDFDKAKNKAVFLEIMNILRPEKKELLSFYDIKSLVKPMSEVYRGMKAVNISDIVGSEGRYHDFNKTFLPKKEHLRARWVRIDTAYHTDVNLPPIRLYKLGDVYFVRDGNHRVSVARSQGVGAIDAEVVELTTMISITPDMSKDDLVREVIKFEKKRVIEETEIDKVIEMENINFTTPGCFDEMLRHIMGHKYFINQRLEKEIPFSAAAESWYINLYHPILKIIQRQNLLARFPGRTEGDLYLWIVKHWDNLKRKYGQEFPLEEAAVQYAEHHGDNFLRRLIFRLKNLF